MSDQKMVNSMELMDILMVENSTRTLSKRAWINYFTKTIIQ
jgi:hypothetical protein